MIFINFSNGSKSLMNIVQGLNNHHLSVTALSLHRPSLDDVFLSLTGQKSSTSVKSTNLESNQ